jgi:hypothetical protein
MKNDNITFYAGTNTGPVIEVSSFWVTQLSVSLPSLGDENRYIIRNVVLSTYLGFCMMGKVQKPIDTKFAILNKLLLEV